MDPLTGRNLIHSVLTMGLGGAAMLTGEEAMEIRGLMRLAKAHHKDEQLVVFNLRQDSVSANSPAPELEALL